MPPLGDVIQAMFGDLPGRLAVATIIIAAFPGAILGSSSAWLAITAS